MASASIHSPIVALINPVYEIPCCGADEFMLQYGEASGPSNVENTGTVCAEVYFIYEEDPVCISGSGASDLDGKYWQISRSSSTFYLEYYAASVDKYLYYKSGLCTMSCSHWWIIADEVDADTSIASCGRGIDTCSGSWNVDPDMTSAYCQDICISGNYRESLDGQYTWMHYNLSMRSSVYYCATCETQSYLFVWLFDDNTVVEWRIGPDYKNAGAYSACTQPEPEVTSTGFTLPNPVGGVSNATYDWPWNDVIYPETCVTWS
eukprot:306953_1